MSIAYLNGDFIPLEEARVSVLDRGFLFADAIYEVIPVYAGKLFRFSQHMQRLQKSLQAIELPLDRQEHQWLSIFEHLIEVNQQRNAIIYLHISRGAYPERSHDFPCPVIPTILAMISPLPAYQEQIQLSDIKGLSVITAEDIRWHRCDIKATSLLANCLMKQRALESGADDTILVRDGLANEATSSNLFIVKDDVIITPPYGEKTLPGVTRDFVVKLAKKNGVKVEERYIKVSELTSADEVWLTSSSKEICPVTQVDGVIIGEGKIGPAWIKMNQWYQRLKKQLYTGEIEGGKAL